MPVKINNLEEMGLFLERYNLPRLNQEEIENMNRPITSTEIEIVIKNIPTNEWGYILVADHMLSMYEALGSVPSTSIFMSF